MKNKGLKILIVAAIALALIMAGVILVKESGMDTSKIQEAYLEVITEEGSIERIQVTDPSDVEFFKVCFSGETSDTVTSDDGSEAFVEGGYRLILAQPDKEWHLYPFAGDPANFRLGDSGDKYFNFENEVEIYEELSDTIDKYIDIQDYQNEYDWKQAIMDGIKKQG